MEKLLSNVESLTTEINYLKAENQEIRAEYQAVKTELQQLHEKNEAIQLSSEKDVFHAKENILVGGIEKFLENAMHYVIPLSSYTEWYQFFKGKDETGNFHREIIKTFLLYKNYALLKIGFQECFKKIEWLSHSKRSNYYDQNGYQHPNSSINVSTKPHLSGYLINTRTFDDGWDHNNTKFAIILHPEDVSKSLEFEKVFGGRNVNSQQNNQYGQKTPTFDEWKCENIPEDYYSKNKELIICLKKYE